MKRQCPSCRNIMKGVVTSCDRCGFSFVVTPKEEHSFAETCLRIGIAITVAAGVTVIIAKLI